MALAESVGGTIDNTSAVCHGPSVLAIHTVGIPSVHLGEIINRADTVLYWGCNPANARSPPSYEPVFVVPARLLHRAG